MCWLYMTKLFPQDQFRQSITLRHHLLCVSVHCKDATVGRTTACLSSFTSRVSSLSVRDENCVTEKKKKTYPITPSFVLLLTQIKETFRFTVWLIAFVVSRLMESPVLSVCDVRKQPWFEHQLPKKGFILLLLLMIINILNLSLNKDSPLTNGFIF